MLRKIKLYGELAKFVGQKTFEAEVSTAAQAIKFLLVNFPKVEKHISDRHYKITVGTWELGEKELIYPSGTETIKIIPVVGGAGGRGTGRFILGTIMIGAAIAFPGAVLGAGGFSAATGYSAFQAIVGNVGIALALTGLSQMLTPVPPIEENEQDPRLSFNFSGIQNTSRAGVAVPVIYGQVITGSITISANIENEQVEV